MYPSNWRIINNIVKIHLFVGHIYYFNLKNYYILSFHIITSLSISYSIVSITDFNK